MGSEMGIRDSATDDKMTTSSRSNDYREQDMEEGTPQSTPPSTPENGSPYAPRGTDTGDTIIDRMDKLDVPSTPIPAQVQLDLLAVRQAVESAGGLVSQKAPDFEKMKPRVGQELEVLNEALDIGDEIFIPDRPAEHTLPKLNSRDLLPPSSTAPIPLEYEHVEETTSTSKKDASSFW